MGNFLDAVVRNVENKFTKRVVTLNVPVELNLFQRDVRFVLPRGIDIQKGDTISFYQGSVRLSDWQKGARITNDDYFSATIFRDGKATYEFDSDGMKKLFPVYRRVQESEITISAPFAETSLA